MKINIYTDGSYTPKTPDYAGYGFVLVTDDDKKIGEGYGQAPATSRQILGELASVMRGCLVAIDLGYTEIVVHHDLEGTANWANGTWKRKNKGTQDYYAFMNDKLRKNATISFNWVKGHDGNQWNEYVDALANQGRITEEHVVTKF